MVQAAIAARDRGQPGWADVLREAASCYYHGGWELESYKVLDQLIERPGTPSDFIDACRQKAQYAADVGDSALALSIYDKLWPYVDAHPEALEISAHSIASAILMHSGVLERAGRFEEALQVCDRAMGENEALFISLFDRMTMTSIMGRRSRCYEALGQDDQAILALDWVIANLPPQDAEMFGLKYRIKRAHLRDGDRKVASPEYLRDMAALWNNQELAGHPDMFEVGGRLVDGYIRAGMPWEARVTAREVLARLDANRAAWTGTGPGAESTARQHEITLLSTLQTSYETIGLPEWSIEAMERLIPLEKDPRGAANLRQQIEDLKIAMAQNPERFQKVFEKARR